MNFICDENTFVSKKLKNRAIHWKISDQVFGKTATSKDGDVLVTFTNAHADRYDRILITTDKNKYRSLLDENLIIEVRKNECD